MCFDFKKTNFSNFSNFSMKDMSAGQTAHSVKCSQKKSSKAKEKSQTINGKSKKNMKNN